MLRSILLAAAVVTATVTPTRAQYIVHEVVMTIWPESNPAQAQEFRYTGNAYPTEQGCKDALEGGDPVLLRSIMALNMHALMQYGAIGSNARCVPQGTDG